MASAVTHALVGGAIGLVVRSLVTRSAVKVTRPPSRAEQVLRRAPWLCAAAAVLPDADVVMHAFVPYSHALGHRGAFHSPAFYLCATWLLTRGKHARGQRLTVAAALWGALVSHSLLDMLTDGGLGVAMLWPLSEERFFFSQRPIPVSPLSVGAFFSARGAAILRAELPLALPAFAAAWLLDRRSSRRSSRSVPPATPTASVEESDGQDPDPGEVQVLETEECIDLHAFAPRDMLDVVDAYLEAACERGFTEVRLIHGRGKGVQRARIRQLLARHPRVLRFQDAPPSRGGWGATLVWLEADSAN